jgi:hypothetical protein
MVENPWAHPVAPVHDAGVTFMIVRGDAESGPYRCPCCGFITLAERGAFEICDVCYWEDDGQDEHDVDVVRGGPNHDLSLSLARQNFGAIGACNEYCAQFVRAPRPEEHPESGAPYGSGTLHSWP